MSEQPIYLAQEYPNPPSMEKIRAAIENCVCPFCGRGPFKSTAKHVQAVHNIDRHQLRELAGMTTNESLAAPEYSAKMRSIAKENNSIASAAGYVESIRGKSRTMKMTVAGSAKIAATVRASNERLTPEERSARQSMLARSQSAESRAKQAASLAARHKESPMTAETKEKVLAALHGPEATKNRAIAAAKRRLPCGTAAAYNRGCRCEPCRAAKRATR